MNISPTPRRLRSLPMVWALGINVPTATRFGSRLLGLALLSRERAGPGLLIPRCRSVHTFGMRFALDVVFLDDGGEEIRRARVGPCRFARERRARATLELPASASGSATPAVIPRPGGTASGSGV